MLPIVTISPMREQPSTAAAAIGSRPPIGRMSLKVVDPLKRRWERGIYMGADSTNPEAVKRHRPQGAV